MKYFRLRVLIFLFIFIYPNALGFSQAMKGSQYQSSEAADTQNLHYNNWSLIIYRPQNNNDMNLVRCWLKLEDENGTDVTYSAVRCAKYEWVNGDRVRSYKNVPDFTSVFNPNVTSNLYNYQRTYYLSGGMAMHLNLKPGKYKISFYTPVEKNNMFETSNEGQWESNVFEYDTQNPAKVIFVMPTVNENGFYNGGWYVDYKAPVFLK